MSDKRQDTLLIVTIQEGEGKGADSLKEARGFWWVLKAVVESLPRKRGRGP